MSKDDNIIVGLDIGTSKVVALVGRRNDAGRIKILGMGLSPSNGLEQGVVIDIDAITQSIKSAISNAELMSGLQIHSVFIGISGLHIRGINSEGKVGIQDREVSEEDLQRVMASASIYDIAQDYFLLHVLPQQFTIDQQKGIRKPVGMSGVRLEVNVHLVTAGLSAVQNITKAVNQAGLDVENVVLEQLASSYAVLTEDEKSLGVCLIDIGAGTTDMAVYTNGAISHISIIAIAGNNVTRDISCLMHTERAVAEDIKKNYGCTYDAGLQNDEDIYIATIGEELPRKISKRTLTGIIQPRYEELFAIINEELSKTGFAHELAAGLVLTGGSSNIEGICELAKEKFEMPVRVGRPIHVDGLGDTVMNAEHSTAVGLLIYGANENYEPETNKINRVAVGKKIGGVWDAVKNWFTGNL